MNNRILLLLISWLFSAFPLAAQTLPKLPSDPAIHQGILPNGTKWFIAVNPSTRQTADFALVQKVGSGNGDAEINPFEIAGRNMASLPHFRKQSPAQFLSSKGIMPGKDGYVKVSEDATIYRLSNVLMYDEKSVTDSTLLFLFDVINSSASVDDGERGRYAPSNQAIIVSGDVKPESVVSIMYAMSLMVNAKSSLEQKELYRWVHPAEGPVVVSDTTGCGLSELSFKWQFPRTPEDLMETIQPALVEMVMNELGILAARTVQDNFKLSGIPYSNMECVYVPSSATSGNESFTISIDCPEEKLADALGVMSGAMSAIASSQIPLREFISCKSKAVAMMAGKIASPVRDNSEYIDRCADAFLHHSSLASAKQKYDFYTSRVIEDETELGLFNSIVHASLSDLSCLTVSCCGASSMPEARVKDIFMEAWKKAECTVPSRPYSNVAYSELPPVPQKFKVISSKTDRTSGSSIWVFSNGFTVVYKKMPTEGNLFCSLSLNGGYGNVPDLVQGEGAFFSDYLNLCLINGCPGSDFFRALEDEGVYLHPKVSLANMKISGVSPSEKLPLLMNALISVFNHRTESAELYPYYKECQQLRYDSTTTEYARMAEIDRIICPDNKYSEFADPDVLSEDFLQKGESLFRAQAEKMDDGVLVLVGDMDESALKKVLQGYVHCFKTSQKAFPRSYYRYQPVSGTSVYSVEGETDMVDIVMTAPYSLTSENMMSMMAAESVLRNRLAPVMARAGYAADVKLRLTSHPQERLNLIISAKKAGQEGFGQDFTQADPIETLALMREVLASLDKIDVQEAELKACKESIKGKIEYSISDPAWWVSVLSKRYMEGKDMYTSIKAKADAVSAEKISAIFNALSKGTRVEYVTKAKGI